MPVVPQWVRAAALRPRPNAIEGCIVVSTEKMRLLELDVANRFVVTQPGMHNAEPSRAVAEYCLSHLPDRRLGVLLLLRGFLLTNSGARAACKYVVTTYYVLGLEALLAESAADRPVLKGVAGYHLTKLFVGSEGHARSDYRGHAGAAAGGRPAGDGGGPVPDGRRGGGHGPCGGGRAGLVLSLLEIMDRQRPCALEQRLPAARPPTTAAPC